jgi:hypothetical protein
MIDNDLQVIQADTINEIAPVAGIACLDELYERKGEVVCFTPGLLVTIGKFPLDPVREFAARFPAPKEQQPFCLALPPNAPPFFYDIGVSNIAGDIIDWDRRIYGISKDRAKVCFDFLGGIGVHGEDHFASAAQHEIQLPDPLARFERKTIPLQVFGVFLRDKIHYLVEHPIIPPYVAVMSSSDYIAGNKMMLNADSAEIARKLKDVL